MIGIGAWALFLGGIVAVVGAATARRPRSIRLAPLVAVTVTIVTAQIGDDRLSLTAWVLIGIGLASALSQPARARSAERDG